MCERAWLGGCLVHVCNALCIYVNGGACVCERVHLCVCTYECVYKCEQLCMTECVCAHNTHMHVYAHMYKHV